VKSKKEKRGVGVDLHGTSEENRPVEEPFLPSSFSLLPLPKGRLFVLSGASGAGKDTLLLELLKSHPDLQRCVTYTTRPPRAGEVEGVDYHFVDVPTFREMIAAGGLLEWAEVYGRYYGNSREWVLGRLEAGQSVILRIDVQGALTVRKMMPEAVLIFVAPPSMEELERRLTSRASESPEELKVRLDAAHWEIEQQKYFDYLVVNVDVKDSVELIRCIVRAEQARI
jgi:guanylate kinase